MKKPVELEKIYAEINAITEVWSQGDCYLGSYEFYFKTNPSHHIASKEKLNEDDQILSENILGFSVISQTCDIVRCCKKRPYIEISPVVEVDEPTLLEIEKGQRPNYGYLPSLKNKKYVIDFDRVMTVEKSCLKSLNKTVGCESDEERRSFANALARKRVRFAFPNDFGKLLSRFRKRVIDKHDSSSDEGIVLGSLREIRVAASPSWGASEIDLQFYFIKNEDDNSLEENKWDMVVQKLLELVVEDSKYTIISGEVTTLEALSAREYIGSDQLDLDHLSI